MNTILTWYVLRSKPHKEKQVHSQLLAHGVETYYPILRVRPVNPRSAKIRPYFPGYLFVHVDLAAIGLGTLQYLPGAAGLVQFDNYPPPIPDSFIVQLKQRITTIEQSGGLALDGLKHGDVVRITDGPLAGYEAIFDVRLSGTERVRVLLDMLGRLTRAEVRRDAIEKKRTA